MGVYGTSYGSGKDNPNNKDGKTVGRKDRPEEFSEYEKERHAENWLDKSWWDIPRQNCRSALIRWRVDKKLSTMRKAKKEFDKWQRRLHHPSRPPITSAPGKRRGGGVREKKVFSEYARQMFK